MPSIDKYNDARTGKPGFWRRQFDRTITGGQRKFDWLFGVIMPTICFLLDPVVFNNQWMILERPLLGGVKTAAFVLSFVATIAIMASLLFGEKLKGFSAVLAGLFAVAGGFSLFVGLYMAPLSLLGMVVLIGFLGFTPLFTSFVYFRNAVRTFRAAEPFMEQATLMHTLLLSALASAVIPYLLNLG
ncbi:MAG: hypothetical protein QM785_06965 [Pyrinomonadaceae bacterium]